MKCMLVPRRCIAALWIVLLGSGTISNAENVTIRTVPTSGVHAEQWRAWKSSAGRSYLSVNEESLRYSIWRDNVDYIEEHNSVADKHGFSLKINSFGDLVG